MHGVGPYSVRPLPVHTMPASFDCIQRLFLASALVGAALLGTGCATVTRDSTQRVSIVAVDAAGQPVPRMRCHVVNGAAEYYGDSPMNDVPVRRSVSNLEIECKRGTLIARGTAISRGGSSVLQGMLPGGSALIALDVLTGYHFSYPVELRVRVGEHLVFDISRPRVEMQAETGNWQ